MDQKNVVKMLRPKIKWNKKSKAQGFFFGINGHNACRPPKWTEMIFIDDDLIFSQYCHVGLAMCDIMLPRQITSDDMRSS
jgi:hypothetical protein